MGVKKRIEKLEERQPPEEPVIIRVVYHGPDEPLEDADVIRIYEVMPDGQIVDRGTGDPN